MLYYSFKRAIALFTHKRIYTAVLICACAVWCIVFTALSLGYREAYDAFEVFCDRSGTGDLICTLKDDNTDLIDNIKALEGISVAECIYKTDANIRTEKGDVVSARFWGCDEKELYKTVTVNKVAAPAGTLCSGVSFHYEARYNSFLGTYISIKDTDKTVFISRVSAMPAFMSVYINDIVRCSDQSFCDFITDTKSFKALFGEQKYLTQLVVKLEPGADPDTFISYSEKLFGDDIVKITKADQMPVYANAAELLYLTKKLSRYFFWIFLLILMLVIILSGRSVAREDYKNENILASMGFSYHYVWLGQASYHLLCVFSGAALGIVPAALLKNLITNEVLSNIGIPDRVPSLIFAGYIQACIYLSLFVLISSAIVRNRFTDPGRGIKRRNLVFSGSIACISVSTALVLVSFCYNDSVNSIISDLFDRRYTYDIQVYYDSFRTNKEITDSLSGMKIIRAEPMARYPVVLKKGDKKKNCMVCAIPSDSSLVHIYDVAGKRLFPQENQVILSSNTARYLDATPGDIIEYEILYEDYKMNGSCMVKAISAQYSDFTDFIALETIATYLQSSGASNAANITTEDIAETRRGLGLLDNVSYIYDKAQQKAAFEQEFKGVETLSVLIRLAGLLVSLLIVIVISQNYYRSKQEDLLILSAMGFSERQLTNTAFGHLLGKYCTGLAMGLIFGIIASDILLNELSSSTIEYPSGFSVSSMVRAAILCLLPVIEGYHRLRFYIKRMDIAGLLKQEE